MSSDSKLGTCAQVFRVLFLIFNLLFLLAGLSLLAVGIFLQVTSQNFSFVTGSDLVSGAVLLIVCGLITCVIAGLGFVGACLKLRPLLVVFAIILALLVLLELITGILGFLFRDTLRDNSETRYRERLNETIQDYRQNMDDPAYDEDLNNALDYLQNFLMCCGNNGPMDWGELNGDYIRGNSRSLPTSCDCNTGEDGCASFSFPYTYDTNRTDIVNGTYWSQGCFDATIDYALYTLVVTGAVGITFGIIEVIGVTMALGLCCCITMAKKNLEYV